METLKYKQVLGAGLKGCAFGPVLLLLLTWTQLGMKNLCLLSRSRYTDLGNGLERDQLGKKAYLTFVCPSHHSPSSDWYPETHHLWTWRIHPTIMVNKPLVDLRVANFFDFAVFSRKSFHVGFSLALNSGVQREDFS